MHVNVPPWPSQLCSPPCLLQAVSHAGLEAQLPDVLRVQASANGDVSQPRLNADLVGDLLALDDVPSAAGNSSAAVDLLADLLGDGAPGAAAGSAVAAGSHAVDLLDLLGGHADSQPSISSQPSSAAVQQVCGCLRLQADHGLCGQRRRRCWQAGAGWSRLAPPAQAVL